MSRLEEIKAKEGREINEIKSPFMILDCSDYEWLKEQAERLQAVESWHRDTCALCRERKRVEELETRCTEIAAESAAQEERLQKRNQRYKQALEFYADKENYYLQKHDDIYDHYFTEVSEDEGEKARQALEVSE